MKWGRQIVDDGVNQDVLQLDLAGELAMRKLELAGALQHQLSPRKELLVAGDDQKVLRIDAQRCSHEVHLFLSRADLGPEVREQGVRCSLAPEPLRFRALEGLVELATELQQLIEEPLGLLEHLFAEISLDPHLRFLELGGPLLRSGDRLAMLARRAANCLAHLRVLSLQARRERFALLLQVRLDHLHAPPALLLELVGSGEHVSLGTRHATLQVPNRRAHQDLTQLIERVGSFERQGGSQRSRRHPALLRAEFEALALQRLLRALVFFLRHTELACRNHARMQPFQALLASRRFATRRLH